MQTHFRPVTSKARGVCRYYDTSRGCFSGDRCKFLHGQPPENPDSSQPPLLTPYDQAKKCRYYATGFCKRGANCWFKHEVGSDRPSTTEDAEDELCSICYERPFTYGLLGGCSHVFCTDCIKSWRDSQNRRVPMVDDRNTKKCPMCRSVSKFVTPSSRFWKEGTEEKAKAIQAYKESMSKIPCKYFQKSLEKNPNRPMCPFGNDCFYQHRLRDGTVHEFVRGADRMRRGFGRFGNHDFFYMATADLNFAEGPLDMEAQPTWTLDDIFRPTDLNDAGLAHAARQLHEVGAALDRDSGAPTLERLMSAIENVRNSIRERDTTIGRATGDTQSIMRIGDEVMERLEVLTGQVLASVHELRAGANGGGLDANDSTDTPPPLLVPLVMRHSEGFADHHEDGNSTASSMPDMASVSGTDESEWVDDDDPTTGAPGSDDEETEHSTSNESRSTPSALGNSGQQSPIMTQEDAETVHTAEGAEEESTEPETPAFVTDGRGRVVWSSTEEGDKQGEGSSQPADGGGSGQLEGGGSSGGLLRWLNTLF